MQYSFLHIKSRVPSFRGRFPLLNIQKTHLIELTHDINLVITVF